MFKHIINVFVVCTWVYWIGMYVVPRLVYNDTEFVQIYRKNNVSCEPVILQRMDWFAMGHTNELRGAGGICNISM